MDNNSLEVNNVSKSFKLDTKQSIWKLIKKTTNSKQQKSILALDGISFSVPKGEVLSIIGLNGSGKSTLLRTIAGVYKPDSGYVKVNGSLSPLMQLGAGFQLELNAIENIVMNGMLLGISKPDIEDKVENILEFAELERFSNMKLKHYSSGMKSRLAFATAIQIDPDILLVDEILAVGDKDFQKKSYESFLSFKNKNKTILHATHALQRIPDFSDRVLLLDKGKNVMIGKPDEVIKKYMHIKSSS